MAVSTDPLQREQIGVVARDTGARLVAPGTNSALQLASSLAEIQPALNDTLQNVAQAKQADAVAQARKAAIETSGADLADAVRLGKIKPTNNPWFVDAYTREAAAIRGTDAMSKLSVESASWAEKNDPAAFASKWRESVAQIAQQFTDPEQAKGFLPAEAQATEQALSTNQAYNSQRITTERQQNLGALASDALQRVVQASGGHISGSAAAQALAPAKAQWIATGGSLEDWNKIAISAVTAASYSIRSPHLLDLIRDPALLNGPRENDTSNYGDGTDDTTPQLPAPLQVPPAANDAAAPAPAGARLQPPAMGRISNTFQQHLARGSGGVDIAVPIGTKLTTPIGGTAEVGYQKGKGGLFVKIVGDDGKTEQVLAHLSLASVQNGQRVVPGTVIGRSGQSGDATGPHVHWQLKVDGHQVDPLSYHVPAHEEAAPPAAEPQVSLAGAPEEQAPPPQTYTPGPVGPSLYDMPGVADTVEENRYRISAAVKSEATDRLQAITASRKLDALAATDRLFATFGTKLITGDVSPQTIISTLTTAGYSPQVVAGALDEVQNSVSTSATLANARATLAGAPGSPRANAIFNTRVEGITNGYSPAYETKVANMVASGEISADDGAQWVSQAQSKTESQQAQARAQTSFNEAQADRGTPGVMIKKARDLRRGIDSYTDKAVSLAQLYAKSAGGYAGTATLSVGAARTLKSTVTTVVMSYLADHPNDWSGAEQTARDFVARFLANIAAAHQQHQQSKPAVAGSATGSNPRGQ